MHLQKSQPHAHMRRRRMRKSAKAVTLHKPKSML